MIHRGTGSSWAEFSEDGSYRFVLGRVWVFPKDRENRILIGVLLNPSTADELEPDPTLTRCCTFARDWDYDGYIMLNAYAFRSTDPTNLPRTDGIPNGRAIGPGNDDVIKAYVRGRDVLVGWGNECDRARAEYLSRYALADATRVDCLAINANGSPRHPLYVAKSTERIAWTAPSTT